MLRLSANILYIFTFIALFSSYSLIAQPLHKIPAQTLKLYILLSDSSKNKETQVKEFEISNFITFKEYKIYLASVKKDSSLKFYSTQLPDTSICINIETYNKYISDIEYDNYPVLGISWDNAMNYCKWKTKQDNPKDTTIFFYRLPHCSEWLAAKYYFEKNKIVNDLNKKYSDWLINSKDESHFFFTGTEATFTYDYFYVHSKVEAKVLKRKFVIGNSYLFQKEKLMDFYTFSYYANEGYRQIAFRYVKDYGDQSNYYSKKSQPSNRFKLKNE